GNETTVSVVIDKTVPVVEGVEDGAYYREEVTPTFNEGTATLNGEPYVSGTPITEEGEYELVVTDEAGNKTTVTFTIDKTVPVVEGVEDGAYYGEEVIPIDRKSAAKRNGEPYGCGRTITEEGEYEHVVTDAAGNKTEGTYINE